MLTLILCLSRKLGKEFDRTVLDSKREKVKRHIKILVNGRDIELLNGVKILVKNGDIVQLLLPIDSG